ncbi:MAG: glycine zipper domain-containing protein [Gammaproteobacteria bacterium]|nr:glycine zipper domain-containing protein [Gammaproteobacteria bacterium]
MKCTLVRLTLISMIGLAGCASNTQSENTTLGVVTGAVLGGVAGSFVGAGAGQVAAIGVGAIVGALIGGKIGNSMDHSDQVQSYKALSNDTNQPAKWTNKKTATDYTMTPTSDYFTVNGNPNCRNYHFIAKHAGAADSYNGTACYRSDGSWYTVKA